jgi:hypothetical protein
MIGLAADENLDNDIVRALRQASVVAASCGR